MDESLILVHHRRPSARSVREMITICRRCHARIHHTNLPSVQFVSVAVLRTLWREQHPDQPEQLLFAWIVDDGQSVDLFEQVSLFC